MLIRVGAFEPGKAPFPTFDSLIGRLVVPVRADAFMEKGDMDGRTVWRRIIKAVEELLAKERAEDAEVH